MLDRNTQMELMRNCALIPCSWCHVQFMCHSNCHVFVKRLNVSWQSGHACITPKAVFCIRLCG